MSSRWAAQASSGRRCGRTQDPSGIADWTYADFDKLLLTGIRKNGKKLDPFMPVENLGKMDETEKKALFAHLQSLKGKPFGGR